MSVKVQRGETFAGYNDLETHSCPSCGVLHALPTAMANEARRLGNFKIDIHCPNGHTWGYGDGTADRERKKREEVERQLSFARQQRDAERDLRQHTEDRLRAQKGATTKAKKRHAAGVCPCCQRTFQNVVRHMETQHPDFDPAAKPVEVS